MPDTGNPEPGDTVDVGSACVVPEGCALAPDDTDIAPGKQIQRVDVFSLSKALVKIRLPSLGVGQNGNFILTRVLRFIRTRVPFPASASRIGCSTRPSLMITSAAPASSSLVNASSFRRMRPLPSRLVSRQGVAGQVRYPRVRVVLVGQEAGRLDQLDDPRRVQVLLEHGYDVIVLRVDGVPLLVKNRNAEHWV